jgi:DNA-binding NtrC family response regulator
VKRYLVLEDENLVAEELQVRSRGEYVDEQPMVQPRLAAQKGLKALVRNLKDEAEAREILRVLEGTHWNRKLAAQELHISYKALSYKIKQYRLSADLERGVG